MPCLLVLLSVLCPRFLIVYLAIFTKSFSEAIPSGTLFWGILGFLLAPYSLLAYTGVMTLGGGEWDTWWYVVMAIAVLMDINTHKESSKKKHRGED